MNSTNALYGCAVDFSSPILLFTFSSFWRDCRRGREGSYPPSPRTNPDVRNYRIGLFRDTRFRMITCSATHCLFPAVRFTQFTSPACLACVSSTSCVSLSTPFPCERRYRLRVLRVDPPPDCLWLSYLSFRFAYLLFVWWTLPMHTITGTNRVSQVLARFSRHTPRFL